MKLNITQPLVIFDLETTGLDLVRDRVIQIAWIKIWPDGREERGNELINPGIKIPPLVQELTSITDEMVAGKPSFKELCPRLTEVFRDADLAGYNSNRFDIPMLAEEMLRAGSDLNFEGKRMIDAMIIFRKMERRNLAAAYKFYCGGKMEEDFQAHLADQDTEATYRVLQGQLDMYAPGKQEEEDRQLENDMDKIDEFCRQDKNVDFAARIIWKEVVDREGKPMLGADGKPLMKEAFNFGKYKDWYVTDALRRDPGYFNWIMTSDFTMNTKQVLTRIRMRDMNTK